MSASFLLVGLEIEHEVLEGRLSSWRRCILPGIAAAGGMPIPALILAAFNWHDPATPRGWAIPAATDIAFALGVLALLGTRVPMSLKVFLTALAIIDDLGAVLIITVFYASALSLPDLALAAMNRLGVSLLRGIGFTMSLFIAMLAFAGAPLLGWLVLRRAPAPSRPH